LGYASRQSLLKKMKLCHVRRCDDVITIGPTHREKLDAWSGDGIAHDANILLAATATSAEIGTGLRAAFAQCT
jgi:hypothetical protein